MNRLRKLLEEQADALVEAASTGVGPIFNSVSAENTSNALNEAACNLALEIVSFKASTPTEIDAAFACFASERADALFIAPDGFFTSRGDSARGGICVFFATIPVFLKSVTVQGGFFAAMSRNDNSGGYRWSRSNQRE